MTDIAELETSILAEIDAATDETILEAVRVGAIGKKGSISEQMKTLGKMSNEERQVAGPALNGLKARVTEAIKTRQDVLKRAGIETRLASEKVDVTLPVRANPLEVGRIHPISQVMDEITAIFADMGFSVAEGPTSRPSITTSPR